MIVPDKVCHARAGHLLVATGLLEDPQDALRLPRLVAVLPGWDGPQTYVRIPSHPHSLNQKIFEENGLLAPRSLDC